MFLTMKSNLASRGLMAAIMVAALTLGAGQALADQSDLRLNAMFNRLHQLDDPREAARIEAAIWQVWGETSSDTADLLFARGVRTMDQRNYDLALDSFSALIELQPDFAEGWNKRATVHYILGNLDASIADVERTLELAPRHFGALSGLGQIYMILGRPEEAIRAFRRALAANPFMLGVRNNMEALLNQIGDERI